MAGFGPTAYSTIPNEEMTGSPTVSFSTETHGTFQAEVTLQCAWENRTLLAEDIVSNYQLYPRNPESQARATSCTITPVTACVSQDTSHVNGNKPYYTGPSDSWTISGHPPVVSGPFGPYVGPANVASYERAELKITYKLKAETETLISESLEPTCEFMTLPATYYKYKTSKRDLNPNALPGRLIRGMEYGLTFYKVPTLPHWIISLTDYVNANPVTAQLLGLTFPAQTLLFNPPTTSRKWTFNSRTADPPYWQMVLKFTCKPQGCNKVWDPDAEDGPIWDDITHNGMPSYIYPLGDFSQITGFQRSLSQSRVAAMKQNLMAKDLPK